MDFHFDSVRGNIWDSRRWVLLLCFLASWCSATEALGADISDEASVVVSGTTRVVAYQRDGRTPFVDRTEEFIFAIGDSGNWNLEIHSKLMPDSHVEIAFDGKNVINMQYNKRLRDGRQSDPRGDPPEIVEEFSSPDKGRHLASISPGEYPSTTWPSARFTWLALASFRYLEQRRMSEIPAVWEGEWSARRDVLAFGYRTVFENTAGNGFRSSGAPPFTAYVGDGLPAVQELAAFDDPTTLEDYHRIQDQLKQFEGRSRGVRAAEYRILSLTNFHGFNIPVHYVLTVFQPDSELGGTNQVPAKQLTGRIEGVTQAKGVRTRPQPLGQITVNDYRFESNSGKYVLDALRYRIIDGSWKETNDLELVSAYSANRYSQKRYSERLGGWYRFGAVIVCATLLVTLFWRSWNGRRKKYK